MKLFLILLLFLLIPLTFCHEKTLHQLKPNISIEEINGIVDDCCCDAESVDKFNNDNIHYILEQLTSVISVFRYFKVDLYKQCPFWAEQHLCSIKEGAGCGACICDEKEVPFKVLERDRKEKLDKVNKEIPHDSKLTNWEDDKDDIWIKMDENEKNMVYLDLTKNPERYTGYEGYNASRIWQAIYMENCFHPKNDKEGLCFEERVFYRLISGFHGSVTAHIAERYYKDGNWSPNVQLYAKNLGAYPERIKNIYFTYLFLIRAVKRAEKQLLEFDFKTGNTTEDGYGNLLIRNLIKEPLLCNPSFDENKMFSNPQSYKLREEFKLKFRNISQLMDCITCETCKIHAKLQILGIGTALKILTTKNPNKINLQRNEIIALINTLTKFSETIIIHHIMKIRLTSDAFDVPIEPTEKKDTMLFLCGVLISLFVIIYSFFIIKSKEPTKKLKEPKTNKTKQKNK